MKRDDGINREHRINGSEFARFNPSRLVVFKEDGYWSIFRGFRCMDDMLTFEMAIQIADEEARR